MSVTFPSHERRKHYPKPQWDRLYRRAHRFYLFKLQQLLA